MMLPSGLVPKASFFADSSVTTDLNGSLDKFSPPLVDWPLP